MGDGNLKAKLFLVGEAPGEREDYIHKPFQGRAGKLLDSILYAFDIGRQDIYISNAVKCRPPGNKKPNDKAISTCSLEYLRRELELVNPELVVALGSIGAQALLGYKAAVTSSRNKTFKTRKELGKYPVIVTYHPAAALYQDYITSKIVEDFERIVKYGKEDQSRTEKPVDQDYTLVSTFRHIPSYPVFPLVALDLETDGLSPYVRGRRILSVQIATEVGRAYFAYWSPSIREEVKEILAQRDTVLTNHNIKFDLKWLRVEGIIPKCKIRDTMIECHLLDENTPDKSLDVLADHFTTLKGHKDGLKEYKKKHKVEHKDVPEKIMVKYGCGDADAAFRLDKYFVPKIKKAGMKPLLDLEMNALKMFVKVEHDGWKIDVPLIDDLTDEYEGLLRNLEKKFMKQIGAEINPRSPKQLMELFYEDWGLPGLGADKRKNRGYDTTEETLRRIVGTYSIKEEYRNAVNTLLQIRETGTILSRYLLGLSNFIDTNGFIHPSFRLDGTDTGRLSCRDPNFQQVPRQGPIKRLFISRYGRSGRIGQFDLSQAELRLAAHTANERKLLQLFRDGGADIHLSVAAQLLRKPEQEVSSEERKRAKTVNFGILYGAGAWKMSRTEIEGKPLFKSESQAKEFIHLWKSNFPDWVHYEKEITKQVIETGEVRNLVGRIRHLLIIDPDSDNGRRAIRQAINSPIQGGVSDYTLHCGYQAWRRLRHLKRVHFVAQVHDAWDIDMHEDHVDEVVKVMKEEFENPDLSRYGIKLRVPMVIDAAIGPNWKEVEKYA